MINSKSLEKLEKSRVKLTVTVDSGSAGEEFDKLVSKYCKNAQIKGFRKGKVPANILLQKYGESIRYESSMNIIEESLKKVFLEIDEKPLSYATPELTSETLITKGEDLTFTVEYDVFPEIAPGEYKGINIEIPEVRIDKKDIETELARYQEQNAVVKEKTDGIVSSDSIVTINYSEVDDSGNVIDGTERQDFVFTVGTGYNYYKIDDEITGWKKDDEKTIEKTFPEDFEIKDLAGTTRKIRIKVTNVKERLLPEIDDELAQDISDKYQTLKDLKEDINKKFQEDIEERLRAFKVNAILDVISASSTIDIPESMIAAELENQWKKFLSQSRMDENQILKILQAQGKTKENLFEDWRENAIESLRKQLIVSHLVEKEGISVSDEEYKAEIEKQAEKSGMSFEDFDNYITINHLEEYIRIDQKNDKLLDILINSAVIKKGKKTVYTDFIKNRD